MFIVATGTPGEAKNVICPAVSKFYVFRNDTTGGFALTLKTSGGTGISVPAGQYKFLYCDGTNVVETFNSAGALTLSGALSVNGTTTLASNPTLSAGTANGVAYANASKVLTTGSGLVFDGTNFSTTGTATATKLVPTGNVTAGNGMYLPATNELAWSVNGSEQMRLTSTGLGIGTSSPTAKLDVRSAIGTSVDATPQNILAVDTTAYAAGNGGGITFGYVFNAGGSIINRAAVIKGIKENATDGNYASALTFSTTANSASTTEKMRLDSSGNLGLGVVPSAKLDIATTSGDCIVRLGNGTSQARFAVDSDGPYIYALTSGDDSLRVFSAVGSQTMTLDASGRLLVGGTSALHSEKFGITATGTTSVPTNLSALNGALALISTNQASTAYGGVGYQDSAGGGTAVVFGRGTSYDTQIIFCTNPSSTATSGAMTERARITSGGDLLVGTTGALPGFSGARGTFVAPSNVTSGIVAQSQAAAYEAGAFWNADTTSNNTFVIFGTETTFTTRGSITYNRAGGLAAYNTTSDYRAKDILGPVSNTGATIDALKVYEGQMKGATQSRPMLVAHEAQAVAPYSVTGEKDAVNDDGTPKFQQMDVSSLVPLLIAEIQSLRARVAALESN
jgi:hypothetical protein